MRLAQGDMRKVLNILQVGLECGLKCSSFTLTFLSRVTWPLGKSLRIMSTLVLVSDYRVLIVEQLCSVFPFC